MNIDPIVNGHFREEEELEERLRIVMFVSSVVSDWRNPSATSSRAIARSFRARGHEVRVLEQRLNTATSDYIRQRRSDPARLLHSIYPDLDYITFDPPIDRESMVWLGREATGADAVIVRADAAMFAIEGMRRIQAPFLAKVIENDPLPSGQIAQIQPAVLPDSRFSATRQNNVLLVAYDDTELALNAASVLPNAQKIVSGSADLPDWEFVPELTLPERYRQVAVSVVVDAPDRWPDLSRSLLGMASGCHTLIAGRDAVELGYDFRTVPIAQLQLAAEEALVLASSLGPTTVPDSINADQVVANLQVAIEEQQSVWKSR